MKHAFALAAGTLFSFGCGSGSADLKLNIVADQAVTAQALTVTASTAHVGQLTAESLESLQYFIIEVRFCRDVVRNGTGYSNPTDCFSAYRSPDPDAWDLYNGYTITDAIEDTDADHYIDLLTAEGKAKLALPTELTEDHLGEYRYGIIDYMRPIKMKGTFEDPAGNALFFTKTPEPADIVAASAEGSFENEELDLNGRSTTGPAELMTYMLPNGGALFPFGKPFEITTEDLEAGTPLVVDFVFNPNAFGAANTEPDCDGQIQSGVRDSDSCVSFNLPLAQLSPVARRAGEKTMKETYWIDEYDTATDSHSRLRIELYYIDSDPDKAIMGADVAVVVASGATRLSDNLVATYDVSEDASGVSFYGYNETTNALDRLSLSGLERSANGELSLYCSNRGSLCAAGDETLSRTYRFEGVTTVAQ